MNCNGFAAGRTCPVHYRYRPDDFRALPEPDLRNLEVLYVVGGLYGNEAALQEVVRQFHREPGRKRMVFNGDFHWFDAEPAWFARVQSGVLQFHATRGNVETELASASALEEAGCGCAYPDWVDDATVERSNRILLSLRGCTTQAQRAALAALPMWLRANVGDMRIAVVHGDATSLSGWGFARENLQDKERRCALQSWFETAQVDTFACSHTCSPVYLETATGGDARWVLNNGAAGMPNLHRDACGLFTRIGVEPLKGPHVRFSAASHGVHVQAIAIEYEKQPWLRQFTMRWPEGTDAHASYHGRITLRANCALPATLTLED